MFYMGFDGTEVTPQIRTLIEDHHLGSILLTTKNLKCKFIIRNSGSLLQGFKVIASIVAGEGSNSYTNHMVSGSLFVERISNAKVFL
jgi:hypothetical protein